MIVAVIPAAGLSSRMGRPKLALPLGDRTVLEHVLKALSDADIDERLVVLGPHVAELAPIAERCHARSLLLVEQTPDMRATVERGLAWVEETLRPGDDDAWLLVPADHPTLDATVIRDLANARQQHPSHSIFVPVHGGRRGHPVLIGWHHVAGLRTHPAGQGLNTYLRQNAASTVEVPAGPDVLLDLDTPKQYETLRLRYESQVR